jgi:hypothetical protein
MVIYRGIDGKPGYHQTDDIHDAIGFVEQMRNDEGVEHARIFRLEEVVFEYRPYYRVELAAGAPAPVGLTGTPPSQLGESTEAPEATAVPVGPGTAPQPEVSGPIDLSDEVIDVADSFDTVEAKATVDAGAAKKGLFGR